MIDTCINFKTIAHALDMEKVWKRIFKGTLVVAVSAAITASAFALSGCGEANASSAGRTVDMAAMRTNEIVESIENPSDKDFEFPRAFGNDFSGARENRANFIDPFNSWRKDRRGENRIDPEKRRQHITRPKAYREYIDKMDDLYLICADISERNAEIKAKRNTIKAEAAQSKTLSNEIKTKRLASGIDAEVYEDIEAQCADILTKAKRIQSERTRATDAIRDFPMRGDNLNVAAETERYTKILKALDRRLGALAELEVAIAKVNCEMCTALGRPHSECSCGPECTKCKPDQANSTDQDVREKLDEIEATFPFFKFIIQ